jgi:hypothetical protein
MMCWGIRFSRLCRGWYRSRGCYPRVDVLRRGVTDRFRANGFRSALRVSTVGLYPGLIALKTFELGSPALEENSFTPYARITLASASGTESPSSRQPWIKACAKSRFRRSLARPSFQSALLRVMRISVVIVPIAFSSYDISNLGAFGASAEQDKGVCALSAEIYPIAWVEMDA